MNAIERSQDNNVILGYLEYINNTQNSLQLMINLISQQDNNLRTLMNRGNLHRNNYRRNRFRSSNNIWEDRDNVFTAFNNINRFSRSNNENFTIPSFLNSSIIVRPTQQQISQATEEIVYSSITNPMNDRCPISQENFNTDSVVTRICHCGHIFNTENINHWFRTSVRCPVCRWDIRDASVNNVTQPSNTAYTQPNNATSTQVNYSQTNMTIPSPNNTTSPIQNSETRDNSSISISGMMSEDIVRRIIEQGLINSDNITLEYSTAFTNPLQDISRNNLNI